MINATKTATKATVKTSKNVKPVSKVKPLVSAKDLEKAKEATQKDLTKTQLVKNLNTFSFVTHWTKTHEAKFDDVLKGDLVSPQLCELKSLSDYLKAKSISLVTPEKTVFNFSAVDDIYKVLTTNTDKKDEKNTMTDSHRKLLKSYLAKYNLVWLEFSRKAKLENVDSLSGKQGLQICGFINHLLKRGYTFKA